MSKNEQSKNEHHPKLKMASLEIQEILKKHDIAGVAILHTPGFIEYLAVLNPSYSCVEVVDLKLKIHAPLVDPQNPNADKAKIAETVNMLANLRLKTGQLGMVLTQAEAAVRMRFNIQAPKATNGTPILKPDFKPKKRP